MNPVSATPYADSAVPMGPRLPDRTTVSTSDAEWAIHGEFVRALEHWRPTPTEALSLSEQQSTGQSAIDVDLVERLIITCLHPEPPTREPQAHDDAPKMTLDLLDGRHVENGAVLQVLSLASDDEAYDSEFLRPSTSAVDVARRLLGSLPEASGGPGFSPSVIGDGGLLIDWHYGAREVTLSIPPDGGSQTYIYYVGEDGDGLDRDVSPQKLTERTAWLGEA